MKLADFEQRVWEVEGIRIVVRGHENDEVEDYTRKNAAMENWRTREFLEKRIEPRVGERKVRVIQGDGEMPMAACSCVLFGNLTIRNRSDSCNKKSVSSATHVASYKNQPTSMMSRRWFSA